VTRLAILGASGHGKVVADAAELSGWAEVLFFDDDWPEITSNSNWPVVGNTKILIDNLSLYDGVIVAVGDNLIREKKTKLLVENDARLVSIIHPSSVVSRYASIGNGSVVFSNVVVNADVEIGSAVILNTGCTIDHDCDIGDMVHISPGVSVAGGVSVGHRTWVGIGACVKQCVDIGDDVIIGAGSVVLKDISDGISVVGNPARFYEKKINVKY